MLKSRNTPLPDNKRAETTTSIVLKKLSPLRTAILDVSVNNNNSEVESRRFPASPPHDDGSKVSRLYQEFLRKQREQRNSLSPYTNSSNIQLSQQMSKLDEIERNHFEKITGTTKGAANDPSHDCAELLFKTNREIKSLNYKLMRVVTNDENYHTLLHPGRINEVEVIEQTPIVCKVFVRGMVSPLKF
jgi:hypothetical protein